MRAIGRDPVFTVVTRRPLRETLYLVHLGALVLGVIVLFSASEPTDDPLARSDRLVVTLVLCAATLFAAGLSGLRSGPLLVDPATLLYKMRTARSAGRALVVEIVGHVVVVAGLGAAIALFLVPAVVSPDEGRAGASVTLAVWCGAILIGAFSTALALMDRRALWRWLTAGAIAGAAALAATRDIIEPGWHIGAATLAALATTATIALSAAALDRVSIDRLEHRANVVGTVREQWVLLTPLEILVRLRLAHAGERRHRWRTPVDGVAGLVRSSAIFGALVGLAWLQFDGMVGTDVAAGLAGFLVGCELLAPLLLDVRVSNGAPLTVRQDHLVRKLAVRVGVIIPVAAVGIALVAVSDSRTAALPGLIAAHVAYGTAACLWSASSGQIDLASLSDAGQKVMSMALGGRLALPPAMSVAFAVALGTLARDTPNVTAMVIAGVAAVVLLPAPFVMVRNR